MELNPNPTRETSSKADRADLSIIRKFDADLCTVFMLCVRPVSQLSPSNPNFRCEKMAMRRLLLFLKPFDANPVLHSDGFSRVTSPQVRTHSIFLFDFNSIISFDHGFLCGSSFIGDF